MTRIEVREVADPAPCFALRRAVFIEEQGFSAEDEFDALDAGARHLLVLRDGVPLGTARLLLDDAETGRIGRICVARTVRGIGLGRRLVEEGVARFRSDGRKRVILGAQVRAMAFYRKLGFAPSGPEYDDEGVPHREMIMLL